jgi:hypothetical protein
MTQLYRNNQLTEINKETVISELKTYLAGHPWEVFVTLSIPDGVSDNNIDWAFKKWRRCLFQATRLEIAYKGIYITKPNKHLHLLMLSRTPKNGGRNLANMGEETVKLLKTQWRDLMHRNADITPVTFNEGIAGYLAETKNAMKDAQQWTLVDNNPKLLRRRIVK